MQNDVLAIVAAWQDAANHQDRAALLALSDPQIAIVGPRGTAHGHAVLAAWLDRAGLIVTPGAVYARDGVVVVAQQGEWRTNGAVVGTAQIASLFHVHDGVVTSYARWDDLDAALAAAGLGREDEQRD